jgi:hypothetical protein
MLEHYIQKNIVYALALTESMRFSELKPDNIENKLFDYHLKKVIAEGYVSKTDDGSYALTSIGRRIGKEVIKQHNALVDRAYSVLFLAVRRADGAWLLCRRKAHPLFNKIGFMHAMPSLTDHAEAVAAAELQQKSRLSGKFAVRGSGYLRMHYDGELESFTHFTLLECKNAEGELVNNDEELAEYYWQENPDFNDPDMLPSIPLFAEGLATPGIFYLEQDFNT